MSDTKLRELERRWKETGTVEDEAAFAGAGENVTGIHAGGLVRGWLRPATFAKR